MQIPIAGHPLHTRSLTIAVSLADDRSWRVRGDVIDLRKCGFVPMAADIQPAGVIHQMCIQLALDPGAARILSLEVDQPHVAMEPSNESRGECCRDPAPRLQALVGECMDAGFLKRLSEVFGGPLGCSHLLTLFQLMASAVPRAIALEHALPQREQAARHAGERLFRRSVFVDGNEIEGGDIGLGVQLGDVHSHAYATIESPLERLAGEWVVRAYARVTRPGFLLRDVWAAERHRQGADLAGAEWHDLSERIAEIEGVPIVPGLARRLIGILGDAPGDRLLLDTLLQMAPGHIQVLAAVMDRWLADPPDGVKVTRESARESDIGQFGGNADSCYMWRRSGPLLAGRPEPDAAT